MPAHDTQPPPREPGSTEPDRIVKAVISGLLDGRYEPGQRLFEADFTAAYGTSRGPVREALNRLSAMGVIKLSKKRGAQVRVHSVSEAIDVLLVVEGLAQTAVRLAAANIDRPHARERMERALEALRTSDINRNFKEFGTARDELFATIFDIAGNQELNRIFPTVRTHIINTQFRTAIRVMDRQLLVDYTAIARPILNGKASEAATAVRRHLRKAIHALKTYQKANSE